MQFLGKIKIIFLKKKEKSIRFLCSLVCLAMSLFVSSCTTVKTEVKKDLPIDPMPARSGIYHKVNKGETLWRIAKTYDVDVRDIVSFNSIPDAAQVEKNQLIFIPGVYSVKEVLLDSDVAEKDFIWPVQGKIIKYFNETLGARSYKGIDIEVPEGTVVKAARTGRVVFADYLMGHGQTIILDHQDGFFTVYAQNSRMLVGLGDMVLKNKDISYVGKKNNIAFLHFQIRKNSKEENPFYYLP